MKGAVSSSALAHSQIFFPFVFISPYISTAFLENFWQKLKLSHKDWGLRKEWPPSYIEWFLSDLSFKVTPYFHLNCFFFISDLFQIMPENCLPPSRVKFLLKNYNMENLLFTENTILENHHHRGYPQKIWLYFPVINRTRLWEQCENSVTCSPFTRDYGNLYRKDTAIGTINYVESNCNLKIMTRCLLKKGAW